MLLEARFASLMDHLCSSDHMFDKPPLRPKGKDKKQLFLTGAPTTIYSLKKTLI